MTSAAGNYSINRRLELLALATSSDTMPLMYLYRDQADEVGHSIVVGTTGSLLLAQRFEDNLLDSALDNYLPRFGWRHYTIGCHRWIAPPKIKFSPEQMSGLSFVQWRKAIPSNREITKPERFIVFDAKLLGLYYDFCGGIRFNFYSTDVNGPCGYAETDRLAIIMPTANLVDPYSGNLLSLLDPKSSSTTIPGRPAVLKRIAKGAK